MLVITVISGYNSTFYCKKEQRGLTEPAVGPIQPAQEAVVPQPVHTPDDGVPGIPPSLVPRPTSQLRMDYITATRVVGLVSCTNFCPAVT